LDLRRTEASACAHVQFPLFKISSSNSNKKKWFQNVEQVLSLSMVRLNKIGDEDKGDK
jgi:hypothetical protein